MADEKGNAEEWPESSLKPIPIRLQSDITQRSETWMTISNREKIINRTGTKRIKNGNPGDILSP
jgi:hypothetical protein